MCGIGGFSRVSEGSSITNPDLLARTLAVLLEDRGTDATGFAYWDEANHERPYYEKDGICSVDYCTYASLPDTMTTCIVHTRHGTKGDKADNANNHPVVAEGICLVHNGVIMNDDALVHDLGTEALPGEVDTRAIAHLLAFGGEVFDEPTAKLLGRIDGGAALAWLDADHPDNLYLAKLKTYPLYIASTTGGDLIFASTHGHVEKACAIGGVELAYEQTDGYLKEGKYVMVSDGQVIYAEDVELFKRPVVKTTTPAKKEEESTTTTWSGKPSFFPVDAQVGRVVKSPHTGIEWIKTATGWRELGAHNAFLATTKEQEEQIEGAVVVYVDFQKEGKTISVDPSVADAMETLGWEQVEAARERISEVAAASDQADHLLSEPADQNPDAALHDGSGDIVLWMDREGHWHDTQCECGICTDHNADCDCDFCNKAWYKRVEDEDWEGILRDYNLRTERENAAVADLVARSERTIRGELTAAEDCVQ